MTSVIWGADYNVLNAPVMLEGEKTAAHRGLDVIRYEADPHGAQLKVLKSGTLNGKIDDHDPLWALFLCSQGETKIRLLVFTVNWGRGYDPGVFKQAVLAVTNFAGEYDHVVFLIQELDEDDAAPEHAIFHEALKAVFEKQTKAAGWNTHEPIVFSPGFRVPAKEIKVVVTMAAGLDLKPPAPKGTGPTRHSVTCNAYIGDIELAFGNTHPHRNLPIKTVRAARAHGDRVFRHQLEGRFLNP